ncbi:RodZ family helix-turn-helix domain-containing protein [uncultured Corynebacterium sp.]|uniref:helix-turn-helix domain-containing protein n=1 Tax=uncultured Corynebacterium sp. TaxID=159447 RepID=UPI0025D6DCE8|nr:helix-turn-helix transcriptional regulator [uncultured Corynebacterium sp.]
MVRSPLTPGQVAAGARLGRILRSARADHGWTLSDVAAAARISPETLRKIETGRLPSPSFGTVVSLCDVLELDIREVAESWTTP